jgi:hypothetical protein
MAKKYEDQAPNNESGNQLPNSGKAAWGAFQQEDAIVGFGPSKQTNTTKQKTSSSVVSEWGISRW